MPTYPFLFSIRLFHFSSFSWPWVYFGLVTACTHSAPSHSTLSFESLTESSLDRCPSLKQRSVVTDSIHRYVPFMLKRGHAVARWFICVIPKLPVKYLHANNDWISFPPYDKAHYVYIHTNWIPTTTTLGNLLSADHYSLLCTAIHEPFTYQSISNRSAAIEPLSADIPHHPCHTCWQQVFGEHYRLLFRTKACGAFS